jgi:hypothetical protein
MAARSLWLTVMSGDGNWSALEVFGANAAQGADFRLEVDRATGMVQEPLGLDRRRIASPASQGVR